MAMLNMYENEKEITIYATKNNDSGTTNIQHSGPDEAIGEPHVQDEAIGKPHDQDEATRDPHSKKPFDDLDYCKDNEESYQSLHNTDNEDELFNYEVETYSFNKKDPTIQVNSKFPNVTELRKALDHHALINEFKYFIEKSKPTRFTERCAKLECEWKLHACVTQDKVTFKVKNLVETYSCIRSNKGGNKSATQGGKEQAFIEVYGKWEDSFIYINVYKEELQMACSAGFLAGCRPYISLDACHLKESWTWFLENLRKAKGTPDGLVISSDMQKGLAIAIMQTYPNSEHKECIIHLYSNFKKNFVATSLPLSCGNLGEYEVCRSSENRAEVKFKGKRWEVILDDTQCTCRVWQVAGLPCVHAAAFITFIRDVDWEKYVDPYYTIKKFKEAYALEIAPLPDKDEWMDIQPGEKICPPIFFERRVSTVTKLVIRFHSTYPEGSPCQRSLGFNRGVNRGGLVGFERLGSFELDQLRLGLKFTPEPDLIKFLGWSRLVPLECEWKLHACVTQDKVAFKVKNLVETHSCIQSNKGGNKSATQGWIANVVSHKIKSEGDVSVTELRKWLVQNYNVDVPYKRVYKGKEQAFTEVYGKWKDSFIYMDVYKEELRNRNPGSVVDIAFDIDGCRPYISLDAPLPDKDEWMDIQPGEKIYPPIIKRPAGRPRKNRTIAADEHTKRRHNCSKCGGIGHRPKTCKNAQSEENEASKSSAVMGETEVYLVVAVS
ncbi:transposase, MuDR, MULE transposase domain protein [Tanacetum coccineum]